MKNEDAADVLRIPNPPATLREIALERMRNAVIEGLFVPGERLVERKLCERLGVSRSVVREVLRNLESEGLVSIVPNQGPIVARVEADEAMEIYELRAMLESSAAAACASKATAETIAALDAALDRIAKAHEAGDPIGVLHATSDFYEILFLTGGKKVSWDVTRRLNSRISRLRALTLASEGRPQAGMKRLRQIRDAVQSGKADEAAAATRTHVMEAAAIALKAVQGAARADEKRAEV